MAEKRFRLRRGERVACQHPSAGAVAFEVLRPLTEGGFGQIHLARSRRGEDAWEYAVLKSPRVVGDGPELSLLLEQRFAAEFDHPNTITYLGACPALKGRPGGPILAFERAFPHPLLVLNKPGVRELLSHDPGTRYYPLPPDVALDLGMDMFQGLVHVHERGYVHHDVKLANLLVVTDEVVEGELLEDRELLDLVARGGVRCVLADLGSCRTQDYLTELNSGEVCETTQHLVPPQLTPIYAPPEAFLELEQDGEKRRQIFPSLDVYAASIVLYATLTGRTPYEHLDMDASSFTELEDIKYSELRGAVVPFTREAIDGIPLHDVDFRGSGRTFADDVFGFLTTCVDPSPTRRPTVQAAQRRLAELFSFRVVDGRLRQGVFRSRRSASRLLETLRGSQEAQPVDAEGGLEAALEEAGRVLEREQRGISTDEVSLALRHVRIAAELEVAFDPITFLLRRGTISVPVARRLRPRLISAGLKLPPLLPLVAPELEAELFELLRDHQELGAEAEEEARGMAERLTKRRVPITTTEILVARDVLNPRVLDWGLGLLMRRKSEADDRREAPRTNSFSVRGALKPEVTQPEPPPTARPRATGRAPSGRVVTKRVRRTGPSIARVSLPTVDIGASDRFYQQLGLTRKAAAKDGSKLLLSDGVGFELELIRAAGPVTGASLVVRFAPGASGDAIERLLSAGLEPVSAADDLMTCVDPSGHTVVVREG